MYLHEYDKHSSDHADVILVDVVFVFVYVYYQILWTVFVCVYYVNTHTKMTFISSVFLPYSYLLVYAGSCKYMVYNINRLMHLPQLFPAACTTRLDHDQLIPRGPGGLEESTDHDQALL